VSLSPQESEDLNEQLANLRDPESDEDIELANKLARLFYRMRGYEVRPGYNFCTATHPHETLAFDQAVVALNYLREQQALPRT
jgi:hypothetical protein